MRPILPVRAGGGTWMFPTSVATHAVGLKPVKATKSRTRCDWSKYPQRAATSAPGAVRIIRRARSKRMTRAAAFGASPISVRNCAARWRSLQPTSRAMAADRRGAPTAAEQPPGLAHLARRAAHLVQALTEVLVKQREPARPVQGRGEPLVQLAGQRAEDVDGVQVDAGQLAGRHAEQCPRPERAHRELDPGLRAVVHDDGGRGVQATHQRIEAAGLLGRVDVLGDVQRLVQREDDRQPRRRQSEVPHRRNATLAVAVVLADDQCRAGHAGASATASRITPAIVHPLRFGAGDENRTRVISLED